MEQAGTARGGIGAAQTAAPRGNTLRSPKLNDEGEKLAREFDADLYQCLERINQVVGPGRELSLVRTQVELAYIWAVKALGSDSRYVAHEGIAHG